MSRAVQRVRFGTRGSQLALWQTHHAADLLRAAHPDLLIEIEVFSTRGDQIVDTPLPLIGGKGLFTAELEAALREHRIDCAVHSLKDLPTESPAGLTVGAVPLRASPAEALISRAGRTLRELPRNARIGTSSLRRAAQVLHVRPDFHMVDIRGNVDTRIRKALEPGAAYDAVLLACAGLERLQRSAEVTEQLDYAVMLPAPGQGALAIQCRDDDPIGSLLVAIQHMPSLLAVTAERAFLAGLGGGCSTPVAALAEWQEDELIVRGRVCSVDGVELIDVRQAHPVTDAESARAAGLSLARAALARGAGDLLVTG